MRSTIFFLLIFISKISFSSEQTGLIESVEAIADGRTLVTMVESRAGKPVCATYNYWFISDENSSAGKSQLSLLLAAHMAKREILISGQGQCRRWVDGEDIFQVKVL